MRGAPYAPVLTSLSGRVLAMASIFRDRENLEAELAMEQEEVGSGRRQRPASSGGARCL